MKLIFSFILMLTLSSFFGGMVCQCIDFWNESTKEKKTITASTEQDQEESDSEENSKEESESEEEAVLRYQLAVLQEFHHTVFSSVYPSFQDHFYPVYVLSEQSYAGTLFSPPELMV